MNSILTYSIAVLVASIASVSGHREVHETHYHNELKAIVDDMSLFVVDNVFDFDNKKVPKGVKECVEMATERVIEYAGMHIKKYCKNATCEIGKRMCAAAKENPKFATGALLYKLKPAKVAAAYCAGKFDLKGPVPMNKELFNEANIFDALSYANKYIYTVDETCSSPKSAISELRTVRDCTTCVVDTALNGIDYLYSKMEKICADNYARTNDYNALVDFKCGLLAKDAEIARGIIFQKFQVMNWSGAFCLGSGACAKKGDNLQHYEEFFQAYHASKTPIRYQQVEQVQQVQQVQKDQKVQQVQHVQKVQKPQKFQQFQHAQQKKHRRY